MAVLANRSVSDNEVQLKEVQAAAETAGQQIVIFNADSEGEFDTAFSPWFEVARVRCLSMLVRFLPASVED